ncbi:hypothetical protein [Haloglomus irregulare]|jgi:hypothetical protein|nr:hypothetical protein [Haloglomus irregulare]
MARDHPDRQAIDGVESTVSSIERTLPVDGRLAAVVRRHRYVSRGRRFA